MRLRFNNDSGNKYVNRKVRTDGTQIISTPEDGFVLTRVNTTNDAANYAVGSLFLTNYTLSEPKIYQFNLASSSQGDWGNGTFNDTTAISQLNFYSTGGTLQGGTIRIYGVN